MTVRKAHPRKLDCFYVYPTVSDQNTPAATKAIDPELRSIALYQTARYSQLCKVYAPVYRQITLKGIGLGSSAGPVTAKMRATAYNDVRDAFRTYLRRYNKGRPFVLIGHSQGAFVLRELVAKEVDPKASVRKRLLSAILLGGNVLVKKGSDRGGDFRHLRACRSAKQLHCIVAFSTFGDPPPANSAFGRPSRILGVGPQDLSKLEVCARTPPPSAGGSAPITTIFPSTPFAPGTTIGGATLAVGFPAPKVGTAWIQADGAYTASCVSANGANALVITRGRRRAEADPTARRHVGAAPHRREHRAGQPADARAQAGRAVREARLVRPRRAAAGARAPAAGAGRAGVDGRGIARSTGAPGSSATCSPWWRTVRPVPLDELVAGPVRAHLDPQAAAAVEQAEGQADQRARAAAARTRAGRRGRACRRSRRRRRARRPASDAMCRPSSRVARRGRAGR